MHEVYSILYTIEFRTYYVLAFHVVKRWNVVEGKAFIQVVQCFIKQRINHLKRSKNEIKTNLKITITNTKKET